MTGKSDNLPDIPHWLEWARKLDAIAQNGLTFSETQYDIERFNQLRDIATDIISSLSDLSKPECLEHMAAQKGYSTPKIDVRGAVIRDGKILLVQEKADECWCMPGGWADVGEPPSESVTREIWEESGFETRVAKVIGVFDANRSGRPLELFHAFKIVFLCEITGGKATTSHETLAVDFFDFNKLPPLSVNRTNDHHLNIVRKHLVNPELPTLFE